MDKRDRRTIEVECNIRKKLLFIEGFDKPICNENIKLKDGNITVQIKPDGFFFIDKDGSTVLSCHIFYNDKNISTVYYFVNQRKFKVNYDSSIFETVNANLEYTIEIFNEYPYKYGKRVEEVKRFYQKYIDDIDFYATKDPSVEYRYARNLFEVMEHFNYNRSIYSKLISSTNNIFIMAYANARKKCNNGRIDVNLMEMIDLKYNEPSYFDYVVELYKLESRLSYHGIEIPENQKVSGLNKFRLSLEGFRTKISYISDTMKKATKYMADIITTLQKEEEGE